MLICQTVFSFLRVKQGVINLVGEGRPWLLKRTKIPAPYDCVTQWRQEGGYPSFCRCSPSPNCDSQLPFAVLKICTSAAVSSCPISFSPLIKKKKKRTFVQNLRCVLTVCIVPWRNSLLQWHYLCQVGKITDCCLFFFFFLK